MKNYYKLLSAIALAFFSFSLSKAVTYFYVSGALNSLSSWNTVQGGGGSSPTSFTGANDVWNIYTTPTAALANNMNFPASAVVNIGDGTAAMSFSFNSGANFGSSGPTINFNNNSTFYLRRGNIINATTTNFNTGSLFIYSTNSSNANITGDNYFNLQIDEDNAVAGASTTVNGTLTISSGVTMNVDGNSTVTITGAISGDGVLFADNTSILNLTGSGNVGTLNLSSSGNTFKTLNVSLGSSSSTLTLGENVTVDTGTLTLGGGNLDFAGKTVSVTSSTGSGFVVSGSGSIIGSNSSVLVINAPSVSGSLSFNSSANSMAGLVFNSSGNSMSLGNTLNIADSIVVTTGTISSGGNLNLLASSSAAARIGIFGTNGNITGNVTVQTFFQSGNTGWATLGTTGISGRTMSNLDGQIAMTCEGCLYGVTATGGYFESIQGWDEANCVMDTVLTSTTVLTPGRGFFIYLGNSTSSSSNMTWSLTGSINRGAINIGTTYNFACTGGISDGLNLLANPYASPIDVVKLRNVGSNSTNFTDVYYQWSRNNGAWTDWNANSNTGTGSAIVPAGGGFFVENNAAGSVNFDFNESAKSASNGSSNLLNKGAKSSSNQLRLKLKGQYDFDEALFLIHPSATTGYDKYDSKKLIGSPSYGGGNYIYTKYTTLASFEPGINKYLSLNSFPASAKSATIPVLVRVSISGTYTITATEFENFGSCAVLHDKLTGIYTDLKVNDYSFSINDTTQAPRFEIIICESGGAAVTLNEFYASDNISIGQDAEGPVVKTSFDNNTDAVISVYNLLGQKICSDVKVSGTQTATRFNDLNLHGQVIMIKVTANDQSVTKKLLVN